METAPTFIETLRAKEAELVAKLEEMPIWKQIQGIRSTIQLFVESEGNNGHSSRSPILPSPSLLAAALNAAYPAEGTWAAKILFILNKRGNACVDEILEEMKAYEPGKYPDEELLYKRISQNASILKSNSKIAGVQEGTKVRYYFKK